MINASHLRRFLEVFIIFTRLDHCISVSSEMHIQEKTKSRCCVFSLFLGGMKGRKYCITEGGRGCYDGGCKKYMHFLFLFHDAYCLFVFCRSSLRS